MLSESRHHGLELVERHACVLLVLDDRAHRLLFGLFLITLLEVGNEVIPFQLIELFKGLAHLFLLALGQTCTIFACCITGLESGAQGLDLLTLGLSFANPLQVRLELLPLAIRGCLRISLVIIFYRCVVVSEENIVIVEHLVVAELLELHDFLEVTFTLLRLGYHLLTGFLPLGCELAV